MAALMINVALMADPVTYYVKADGGNDSNDGQSWENAFLTLQCAIDSASAGDQIWVAKGTYIPSKIMGDTSSNDKDKTFFINGLSVYGGFAGTETTLGQRKISENVTTLSGSLGGSVYVNHVTVVIGNADVTKLDGFSITGGNSTGGADYIPVAGVNVYRTQGAGINAVTNGYDVVLANNVVDGNISGNWGGGILAKSYRGDIYVLNNTVRNNSSGTSNGGGIYVQTIESKTDVVNNIISGNSAGSGGGVYMNADRELSFINNTVYGNTGSAVVVYALNATGVIDVKNNIVSGNTNNYVTGNAANTGTTTVDKNLITGANSGGANITTLTNVVDADPQFVDVVAGNFCLQSTSPAINAGVDSYYDSDVFGTTDVYGKTRKDGIIDLGAAEFQTGSSVKDSYRDAVIVYPNPAADMFIVKGLAGNEAVQLFDTKGNLLSTQRATNGDTAISVEFLPAGIYFVRILTGTAAQNVRLIKK